MKNTFTRLLIPKLTVIRRNDTTALVMRISQAYLLMLTSAIIATASPKGNGQSIENTTVELEIVNKPLQNAFNQIEKQTKFLFKWDAELEYAFPNVSMQKGKYTVKEALDYLLHKTALAYQQHKNHIMILPADESWNKTPGADNPEILTMALVTGTVRDGSTQEVLAGVNVFVKGTTTGTSSDAQGKFVISVEESDILVFSFIGFKTVEIPINGRSVIDVAMVVEASTLQEVVVNAGYYDVKDREKTGSISRVSSKEIQQQPVTNPIQTLQGRVPGMYISQNTGMPGGNFKVQIRGVNSIANGNDPLYIIDGVQFVSGTMSNKGIAPSLYGLERNPVPGGPPISPGISPLNSINPSDIESIEILKDADATAIYGSRGANGVILITTKKGKAGAVKINVNVKSGGSKLVRQLDLMNTQQYLAMRRQAVSNDGNQPVFYEYDINETWDQNRYTDWQKVLLGGMANITDINGSISGGSNDTQFLIGAGYNNQGTIFPGDNSAGRWSTHLSITHASPDKKFTTTLSTIYNVNESDIVKNDLTRRALALQPNAPALYDENGKLNWELSPISGASTFQNPMAWLINRFNSRINNLITNIDLGYEILKGLQVKASIGFNEMRNDERTTNSSDALAPDLKVTSAQSGLDIAAASTRSFVIEPQVDWESKVGKGKLVALLGGTYQSRVSETSYERFTGFPTNALINDPKSASINDLVESTFSEYKYAAIFGRLNYAWDEKYIVNATGRRDGSSRFGPGKQFAYLGAVGIAWIFSNENFAEGIPLLSFGKIRGSYGLTGNDQIGDYNYLDAYATSIPYQGVSTLGPVRLYNPVYGWEVNKKLEGAVDLGLLNNRVKITTAFYMNRSSNQLIDYKLAMTTGFTSVLRNSPATVQNTGLEIEFTSTNLEKEHFQWTSNFNITFPKNKLVSFPNLESSSYANAYIVGKPINIQKVYHYLGVDPQTGQYQIEDVDHDGYITPADVSVPLELGQKFFGGLNNSLSYRRLQIDVLFQFAKIGGFQFVSAAAQPGSSINQPATILKQRRWQGAGDDAAERQYFSRSENMALSHSLFLESDAVSAELYFIRLKNISVSYQLSDKWMKGLKSRVYLQGQNIFTFTNYLGLDPESGAGNFGPSLMPPLTTVVAGVELTF